MKLSFTKPHLSIRSFPDTELPPFTLITGVNGAGKSHLLQALLNGSIAVEEAANPRDDIRLFDWNTLVPNAAGEASTQQLYDHRDKILAAVEHAKTDRKAQLEKLAAQYSLKGSSESDLWHLCKQTNEELKAEYGERHLALKSELERVTLKVHESARQRLRGRPELELFEAILSNNEDGHGIIERAHFDNSPLNIYAVDLFQQSFAQMFLAYFELEKLNKLHELDAQQGRPGAHFLPEEEFVEHYGEPPWDFVNRTLEEANLDFRIDHPTGYTTTSYSPTLTKKSTGASLDFSSLSSGERILMSFAFCLYYSLDDRHLIKKPRILLFDEIDAPLHPSMSRQLMKTITETLVGDHNTKVVMATHAPSTVAVAPEDSVRVMRPGKPGLESANKNQAIAVLTTEIPTLSINFSGRRQVFVEGHSDAEILERLYQQLKHTLDSERSLTFVPVGRRKRSGAESDGGCHQVKNLVSSLREGGNESIYGLVDWDTKNEPCDHIAVLAHKARYSIENCLLDPLLVACLLVRTKRSRVKDLGLDEESTVSSLYSLDSDALQEVVQRVQELVLREQSDHAEEQVDVEYQSGIRLSVSRRFLQMRGHDLEEAVKATFPELKRFKNQGSLLSEIVDPILKECEGFLPKDITSAFSELLEMP